MAIDLRGIADWLHGWFPFHSEVVAKNQTSANANKNIVTDSSGEVTTENKVSVGTGLAFDSSVANKINHSNSVTAQSSTALKKISFDGEGHITGTDNVGSFDLPSHNHSIGNVTHLQQELDGIDTRLDNLESIKAIEVVSTKPTASADTMNKLYIVAETISGVQKVNVYYTKQTGSTYEWVKLDDNILDELSIDWSEIENNPFSNSTPSSFANASHTHTKSNITDFAHSHGNIMNDGQIGNSANKVIMTQTGGLLTAVSTIGATNVADANAHSNIGSSASATQGAINTAIDTAIGNKADASDVITSIVLVSKNDDANGKIIFYTGDEPT